MTFGKHLLVSLFAFGAFTPLGRRDQATPAMVEGQDTVVPVFYRRNEDRHLEVEVRRPLILHNHCDRIMARWGGPTVSQGFHFN